MEYFIFTSSPESECSCDLPSQPQQVVAVDAGLDSGVGVVRIK